MKIIIVSISLLFFIRNVTGQNDTIDLVSVWSLQDCLDYAGENNISIKDARLNKESAEINYNQSLKQRLPNLSLTLNENIAYGTSIDPITSDYISQTINSSSAGLGSQVNLFSGNQLNNQIKKNILLLQQSNLQVEETRNNIRFSVIEAYMNALYSRENVLIAEKTLLSSQKQLEQVSVLYETGETAKHNLTEAESLVAGNQYNLVDARNGYLQQLLVLKQLLELPDTSEFEIDYPILDHEESWTIPDKNDIYESALRNMPEIASSKLSVQISEKELEISRGSYYPNLSLSAGVSTGYTSSQDLVFNEQLDKNMNSNFGVSLSIPIYSKSQTKAAVHSAQINIKKSELEVVNARKALYQEIERSWLSAVSSQNKMISANTAQDAAQDAYVLAQQQFKLGNISIIDLITSQNNYVIAQQTYLQAKYLMVLYKLYLDFYQGNEINI